MTIEAASPAERTPSTPLNGGEEVIDVAEYFGDPSPEQASLVRYIQLKHSTHAPNKPWPPSGLRKTLEGFSKCYKAIIAVHTENRKHPKLEFLFVSNRPISTVFAHAVENAAKGLKVDQTSLIKLEEYTGLTGSKLAAFCSLLKLEGDHDALWSQRNILFQDVSQYLPDADVDAPAQLKELVTRKAGTDGASNPRITRLDVLRALKTDEDHLYPAPCRMEYLPDAVPRDQEADLVKCIVTAGNKPIIIHAEGGVGKSIIATRIKLGLPPGSASILYDCFGNGEYRSATRYRHRHQDALVQIVNELAGKSLCHPLIPTKNAGAADYLKKSIFRLEQAVGLLRAKNPEALLCVVVDAADNAQMTAEEIGEARSFIRDLLRERIPNGVRIVALCRSHRQEKLDPPPTALVLELQSFSRAETAVYLRRTFLDASDQDVDEFHRLSSHNPRVQATALAQGGPLQEILRRLGPNPTTVDKAVSNLLSEAILKMRYEVGGNVEKEQIDRICAGLAALPPLIPISVLSSMSGVPASAIKSFAYDLRRPLIVTGETIQFFDEPSETWFRKKFKPTAIALSAFIASIKPLSSGSAYVAAALPQLMLEAGQFDELVAMALSSEALPDLNPLDRRDVELQRLQFALKASLREKRFLNAAKLALKTGGETAGDERRRRLLQDNTDLASVFMGSDRIQELVSRRIFGSGWIGSHNAYEAALMSGHPSLQGDARSRLRMAEEWLRNWSRLSPDERSKENIAENDICEMATACFNIEGASACAAYLKCWKPRIVSFKVGLQLARRFVDHERYEDLCDLAMAAGDDLYIALAIVVEMHAVHREPPKSVIKMCLRLLLQPKFKFEAGENTVERYQELSTVTALVESGHRLSIRSADDLAKFLMRYMPKNTPRILGSYHHSERTTILRAYALRAALCGETLTLLDLAHPELRTELEKEHRHEVSREIQEFKEDIGALLPWYTLWASRSVKMPGKADLAAAIVQTLKDSSTAARINHREEWRTADEIAEVWLSILVQAEATDASALQKLNDWMTSLKRPLFTSTLARLARRTARIPGLTARSLQYANQAFQLTQDEREEADAKSGMYAGLARSVLAASRSDAEAYFNQAVDVASRIGDENIDRWGAMLDLAEAAADPEKPIPELAYNLSRCAEVTYDYVVRDKHFDWERTVKAIAGLCPSSSFAIMSRWRDRNFGWAGKIFSYAIDFLVKRKDVDARKALLLIGFRMHWDLDDMLSSALDACTMQNERQEIVDYYYHYTEMTEHSAQMWRKLKNTFAKHRITVRNLETRLDIQDSKENKRPTENAHTLRAEKRPKEDARRDWKAIFQGLDPTVANDLVLAQQRARRGEPPFDQVQFFKQAITRVPSGREAEFISALADVPEFDLYHLRNFLESAPAEWKTRLAVKSAFATTLRTFCRRYCMEVTRSHYYEVLPFKAACELANVPESDVIDVVLSGIGEKTEIVGAGRLFTLVGLLSSKLDQNAAREALGYGLGLFDVVLKETDGDGPWSNALAPPENLDSAIAGYIFGALASPSAAIRWEAAHVVHGLCRFQHTAILSALVALTDGSKGSVFADAKLYFYDLHARQWLLIALARAAKSRPDVVVAYKSFILKYAHSSEQHVLIRELAKRTALILLDAELLPHELRAQIITVNVSPFPVIEDQAYDRQGTRTLGPSVGEDGFYFGFDIGPYWFAQLGECFGLSERDITHQAITVIRTDWQYPGRLYWDEDERTRRKILKHEDTYHSHGSYPRADELSFYLSYHAMMVVAGQLLVIMPTYRGADYYKTDFSSWLHSRHDLSRRDGYWLADRRDPIPPDTLSWKNEVQNDDWHVSVRRSDFDRVIFPSTGIVTLWGNWTSVSGRHEETCNVQSALVSPDRSSALLRALQSADDHHHYVIPSADDDRQIDVGPFQLKGWVMDGTRDRGIDANDPWAGGIGYPAPSPSREIIDNMHLTADRECRNWRQAEKGPVVLTVETWGTFREKDDETSEERGNRLQASTPFIVELLRALRMDMIVEVEIKRRRSYSLYESQNHDDTKPIPPRHRLFLVKADGPIQTN